MDKGRPVKLQELKARVEREDYAVDPRAVADAIVARLLGPYMGPALPGDEST